MQISCVLDEKSAKLQHPGIRSIVGISLVEDLSNSILPGNSTSVICLCLQMVNFRLLYQARDCGCFSLIPDNQVIFIYKNKPGLVAI